MSAADGTRPTTVRTIGHSTHPLESFVRMLDANDVDTVVDVRTVPGSRRNPQYGADALADGLRQVGKGYRRIAGLGGLRGRATEPDPRNAGWRNASFRNYADHMRTAPFVEGVEELAALAGEQRVAIMCAEAVPWRCHRSLIGDALLVRGIAVDDIMSATQTVPHRLTSFAVVDGLRIDYPPEEPRTVSSPPAAPR